MQTNIWDIIYFYILLYISGIEKKQLWLDMSWMKTLNFKN